MPQDMSDEISFEISVKGRITFDTKRQEIVSRLGAFRQAEQPDQKEIQLAERSDVMGPPAKIFSDEQQFLRWFKTAFQTFQFYLPRTLLDEVALSFRDQANAALNSLEVERIDMKDIVDDHVKDTADRVKDTLGLQRMGQASQWTKLRLARAIRREVAGLPKEARTLEKVSERLLASYPDKAPSSSDSLRKLITRFELDWKELRNGK